MIKQVGHLKPDGSQVPRDQGGKLICRHLVQGTWPVGATQTILNDLKIIPVVFNHLQYCPVNTLPHNTVTIFRGGSGGMH